MFKAKAITPPRDTLSPAKYKRAMKAAQGIAEVAGLQEAQGITRGWKHRPRWRVERKGEFESDIVTDDEIFYYQNKGTKGPYPIVPKRKRFLFWKGARHPVRRVMHPGVKAQHYTDKIAKTMQTQYKRVMDEQLAKAAR